MTPPTPTSWTWEETTVGLAKCSAGPAEAGNDERLGTQSVRFWYPCSLVEVIVEGAIERKEGVVVVVSKVDFMWGESSGV